MVSSAYLDAATHLWPTLQAFPSTFQAFFTTHSILSLESWLTYYATVDPLHTAIVLCTISATACYVMQQATGNASQVDRIWTFAPVWYGTHFAIQPVLAAKLISSGWANENLLSPSGPVAKLTFYGRKVFSNPDASAHLQPRLVLMLALQLLWSSRLSYNAWRRGFFKLSEEDYRWPELRKGMSRPVWELFSLFFIAIAQNILLAITALPQYLLLTTTFSTLNSLSPRPSLQLTSLDYVLAVVFVLNLATEFMSDHQQQCYQNFKRGMVNPMFGMPRQRKSADDYVMFDLFRKDSDVFNEEDKKRGFITKGLWSLARHPNFACEQMVWWLLFLFVPITFYSSIPRPSNNDFLSLFKAYKPLITTYAIDSPIAMSVLFYASTDFTEKMSTDKYPLYKEYQKCVDQFNPALTGIKRLLLQLRGNAGEKAWQGTWGKVDKKQ